MKIYIVMGSTGRYSSYVNWTVCAYQSEEQALLHAGEAKSEFKRVYDKNKEEFKRQYAATWENDEDAQWQENRDEFIKWQESLTLPYSGEAEKFFRDTFWPWDKNIRVDDTGVDYYVIESELNYELPGV